MRLVVDTNIVVSALLAGTPLPAQLIVLWRQGRFDLLTAAEQLDELQRVTRYSKIRERLALLVAMDATAAMGAGRQNAATLNRSPSCQTTACAIPWRHKNDSLK